jgi:hypothetical protein
MTAQLGFDGLLRSLLEVRGPQSAPDSVVTAALAEVRSTSQRRPIVLALDRRSWPPHRAGMGVVLSALRSNQARVLLLALIATALVALGLAAIGALRPPTSTAIDNTFVQPFEYSIPADSSIRPSGRHVREMVAWVDGPDVSPSPTPEDVLPGMEPTPWSARGIIVGYGSEAWSHGPEGRFMLRTTPAEFLADLRDIAGTPMGPIVETTLDGRPALTTTLPGTGGSDIHVSGRMLGLAGGAPYALVTMPSRLIITEIDGTTVFVLIWARTGADLTAWLPAADAFVRSIHFLPKG